MNKYYENSKAHGWWEGIEDPRKTIPEKLALIHSELSEALECYRDGQMLTVKDAEKHYKPEGFATELADVIIRVYDLAGALGQDIPIKVHVATNRIPEKDIPAQICRLHAMVTAAYLAEWDGGNFAGMNPFGARLAEINSGTYFLAAGLGYDLEAIVEMKHQFNVTRPHRHGGKAC